jgi:DNA-binding CsgD family transcriptional regulator
MAVGLLIFHIVSVSSALGVVIVLGAMYRISGARGLPSLTLAFLSQAASYSLGIILYWGGTHVPAIAGGMPEQVLLSLKFLLQVSVIIWFPLAARGLLRMPVTPAVTAWLAAFISLSVGGLAAFWAVPGSSRPAALTALGIFSLLSYALSMAYAISLPLRRSDRIEDRYRRPVRVLSIVFLVLVESMMAQDALTVLGTPLPPGLLDGACFLAFSIAILVICLDILLSRARITGPLPDWREFGLSHGLTERELDVLAGLLRGSRYKEIALRLSISTDTVKTHAGRVYRKSGVASRTQLRYLCRIDDARAAVPGGFGAAGR